MSDYEMAGVEPLQANVVITFKRSSTKDRGEGYDIRCTEHASENDVEMAFEAAKQARRLCLEELGEMVVPVAQVEAVLDRLNGQEETHV